MADDLFTFELGMEDMLHGHELAGRRLLSVTQAASCLGLTPFETRYAISRYRLDALLVTGEYRIATDWVRRFSTISKTEDFMDYDLVLSQMEIEGVHALMFDGRVRPLVESLRATGRSVSEIAGLVGHDRQFHYDGMPGDEEDPLDWYDLPSLGIWPETGDVRTWAQVLNLNADELAIEAGLCSGMDVGWPEIYDYLVSREVVNLPCPYVVSKPERRKEEDDGQLDLFQA